MTTGIARREEKKMIVQAQNSKLAENLNSTFWINHSNMGVNQVILHGQESIPEIYSAKKIHMIIVMGRIVMQLDDQGERIYLPGNIIDIPSKTKMKIKTYHQTRQRLLT